MKMVLNIEELTKARIAKDLNKIDKAYKAVFNTRRKILQELEIEKQVDEVCLRNPLYQKVEDYIENSANGLKGYLTDFNQRMFQRKVGKDEYGKLSRIFLDEDENGFAIIPMSPEDKMIQLKRCMGENYIFDDREYNDNSSQGRAFNGRNYFDRFVPEDRVKNTQTNEEKLGGLELTMKNLDIESENGLKERLEKSQINLERLESSYVAFLEYFEKHLGVQDVISGLVKMIQNTYPHRDVKRADTYTCFTNLMTCSNDKIKRSFDLLEEHDISLEYMRTSFFSEGYDDAKAICQTVRDNMDYVVNNSKLGIDDLPKNLFTKSYDRFKKLVTKYEKLKK